MSNTIFTHPWSLTLPWKKKLLVEAESYWRYIAEVFPWAMDLPVVQRPIYPNDPRLVEVGGKWVFYMSLLPAVKTEGGRRVKTALNLQRGNKKFGVVGFDNDVLIPTLADKTDDFLTWMSLTPNEIMTQRPGLAVAYGNVCIGGLGLGWLAYECLHKESVRRVTVVEKDPHIAEFFGNRLVRNGKECEIVTADVYNYLQDHRDNFDTILMDIWPYQKDSRDDYRLRKLKKGYQGKLWAWGMNFLA